MIAIGPPVLMELSEMGSGQEGGLYGQGVCAVPGDPAVGGPIEIMPWGSAQRHSQVPCQQAHIGELPIQHLGLSPDGQPEKRSGGFNS